MICDDEVPLESERPFETNNTHPEKVVPKSTPTMSRSLTGANSRTGPLMASADDAGVKVPKYRSRLSWFLWLRPDVDRIGRLKLILARTGRQSKPRAALPQALPFSPRDSGG